MSLTRADALIHPCPIPLYRTAALPHPERAMADGGAVRVRRGIYAPSPQWRDLSPWDRYLTRVHAVALVHPDAEFCLESAAALWGLPVFGDPEIVHVVAPARGAARQVGGVRTHRAATPERTIVTDAGISLTGVIDTAVDIARHRHNAIGLATADAALRADPTSSTEQLLAVNAERASARGRAIARWPLSRATALAESALESVSRAAIEWLGFPEPELQVPFPSPSGRIDRTDCLWRDAGVAGEADGDLKYDGRYGDPRTVLRRQHLRDERLRRHVRTVAHWGWAETTDVAPLRGILAGAGLRQARLEDAAQLHSMRRILSPR